MRHIVVEAGIRTVAKAVSSALGVTSHASLELLALGAVYLRPHCDEEARPRRIFTDCECVEGDYIRVHPSPRRYTHILSSIVDARSMVLFENDHYLVVDKPAGIPSVPPVDNYYECLPEFLKARGLVASSNDSLYVLHRLDIDTSGVLVMAKSNDAASHWGRLQQQKPKRAKKSNRAQGKVEGEQERESIFEHPFQLLTKEYTMIVASCLPITPLANGQLLQHYQKRSSTSPKIFLLDKQDANDLECLSKVVYASPSKCLSKRTWLAQDFGKSAWLTSWLDALSDEQEVSLQEVTLQLLSGRTHQARGQIKALGAGFHIAGDSNYIGITSPTQLDMYRSSPYLALYSSKITFDDLHKNRVVVTKDKEAAFFAPLTKFLLTSS